MKITIIDQSQLLGQQLIQLCKRYLHDVLAPHFQPMMLSMELNVKALKDPQGELKKVYRVQIDHGDGQIVFHQKGENIDMCLAKIAETAQREISRERARSIARVKCLY
ncbi:hypothetical protein [Gimesia fumaroli]|uniref:Sigma 54 modulation protein / S30EA ribosomal protein n=1 Tax=Gimesia fumaroli TaxID=2527976 RepID=A0A518IF87_9PLAN|nr:hypothetical protein [Gimesia fumaroli]QDV51730.1 hypothetical protein Enr17x_37880 [Gimesia fumaroli]